jgi:outer membrane protein assembly factor BamA
MTNRILHVCLYVGPSYQWGNIRSGNAEEEMLNQIGFREKIYRNKIFHRDDLLRLSEKVLNYYENNGYPFASMHLDSLQSKDHTFSGALHIEKGKKIIIDTLIVKGDAKITETYLSHFISCKKGDLYNQSVLNKIDNRLREISFVELLRPTEIVFTEKQCQVVLYIGKKKSSQFNGVIGILPDNTTGKITITGDARLRLRNGFGKGELIDLNWRKLASEVQDLKINFNYPYLFKSALGTDLFLKMYKKDTTYLELHKHAALQYQLRGGSFFKLFIQHQTSDLLSPGMYTTASTLPTFADVSLLLYGAGLKYDRLDYRLNPRSGFSVQMEGSAGNKKIRINPKLDISLYQNTDLSTTQINGNLFAEFFIPVMRRQTIRFSINTAGIYNENLFRNELLRIGGIRTLRGFDEESIQASMYGIGTIEWRFLLDRNSAFYLFFDQAWYERNIRDEYFSDSPKGFGAGIFFQTKAGTFSFNYALGSQQQNPFQLRASKVHFGFVNYF